MKIYSTFANVEEPARKLLDIPQYPGQARILIAAPSKAAAARLAETCDLGLSARHLEDGMGDDVDALTAAGLLAEPTIILTHPLSGGPVVTLDAYGPRLDGTLDRSARHGERYTPAPVSVEDCTEGAACNDQSAAVIALVEQYGDARANESAAMEHAGSQEVEEYAAEAAGLLARIRAVLNGQPVAAAVQHVTVIEDPGPNGQYEWRCLAGDAEASGYEDVAETVAAALAHGPLSARLVERLAVEAQD